ncbi:cation efflux protein/zinc transporter [Drepanopeziza brunnea f. sp. 'multigermtubi' MB_m1]|uniref:Zinc transporter n=1 Tax=Marssonina brunnea f. sp. multigermtubi (strain MB_m1) TaxID=1072389 RepID=K1X364_MARBU|nr:cation efflux protein/zinc transporter [Drepanopeziza brunnea f. sp. 'multigermtubi' MB_m1]EKD19631.1 cation efflux protein/zinc transporter [Drepanopeziza brunnea f. sp. 'multigermtubi' MB_m1]
MPAYATRRDEGDEGDEDDEDDVVVEGAEGRKSIFYSGHIWSFTSSLSSAKSATPALSTQPPSDEIDKQLKARGSRQKATYAGSGGPSTGVTARLDVLIPSRERIMASSYALPVSAMHSHIHSNSLHSPGRQHPARAPPPEKLNGSSLHSHSQSQPHLELDHHRSSRSRGENCRPSRERSRSPYIPRNYLPTPPNSGEFEKHAYTKEATHPYMYPHTHETSPPLSSGSFEPPLNAVKVLPHHHDHSHHDHSHHDHSHHDHSHHDSSHIHPRPSFEQPRSKFTSLVLPLTLRWPILHTIMADQDSRRILYFICLNFSFMLVQAVYGYLTDSLGLLSDSIHMFFDCLALGVGLFASVASKWPPSERFPYGFAKIESLSGFGNGVFLMLISIEILIEALERLSDGRETKRLAELFFVSAMGLAVNLVGMQCFGHHGHHHHGDHAHSHHSGHSHSGHDHRSHSHEKIRSDDHHHHHSSEEHSHHDCDHEHDRSPLLVSSAATMSAHAGHSHSHSHDNENMHGICTYKSQPLSNGALRFSASKEATIKEQGILKFNPIILISASHGANFDGVLHVLADTMGSAAVMLSTALIYFFGWNGFDPLASCVIAILIFLSSVPLIKSCAKKLLLTVPDEIEYGLRDTLAGVSDLRGVATYNVPRFWMGDKNPDSESEQVLGVMHVIATRGSDLDDVRERTRNLLLEHGVDAVVQVEKIEDTGCWCGGSAIRSHLSSPSHQGGF